MNLFRSNRQVALNDLLVASERTADHYRDSADFLQGFPVSRELRRIAEERDSLAQRIAQAVESSGDLPSVPDEDRESVEKLFHRVHASLSTDEVGDILEQRLHAEDEFARIVDGIRQGELSEDLAGLLNEIENHLETSRKRVRSYVDHFPSRGGP